MTAYFDGFYFSEREHMEHVDGTMYRVPQGVWFTAVRWLGEADDHPAAPSGILLMAETKDELHVKLRRYAPINDVG